MQLLAAAGALLGAGVALHYFRLGLTLTHYDARGHLIVARRIFDSITPGWQQIGAVWLPLPHLLNAIPVQIDVFYRTGLSAVAISVVCFAMSVAAIGCLVATLTGSRWAATAGAAVYALNPNVLYLQSTPMTEPLLVALLLLSIALLVEWCRRALADPWTTPGVATVGWALLLACLTRYEAWPVMGGSLAVAVWALWRSGQPLTQSVTRVARIAVYPAAAIVAFFVFSRIVSGVWFADDFFVPENPAQGLPYEVIKELVWGLHELSGTWVLAAAMGGAIALAIVGLARRSQAIWLLPLTLLGTAAVPFVAFLDGHPYRIRYMVPLIAAQAVAAGIAAGVWRRAAPVASALLLAAALVELHPLNAQAAMVLEAQWDRPNIAAREPVSRCLADAYAGESIMASMGSLGHYMQDLSREHFAIRDFLQEGNGDIWLNALEHPRPYAGWILIEEKAEGGDMLAKRAREHPDFLRGYTRVCEGAGLALYRRDP